MDPMALLRQSFLEECDELLSALESCLHAMEEGAGDPDTVNAAFRAIHSIKGGAGAFGFTELVPYAHHLEAALDLLRSGRMRATDAPVPLFLRTADALGACVAAARAEEAAPAFPDIIAGLRVLAGGGGAADQAGPEPETPPVGAHGHRIVLTPRADLFRRLVEPPQMLQPLEAFGEPRLRCDLSGVPALDALDPALCHLRFEIELETAALREQIEDVLERCFDGDEIAILPLGAPTTAQAGSAPPAPPGPAAPPSADLSASAQPAAAFGHGGSHPSAAPEPHPRSRLAPTRTIRVDLDRVDRLMNLVGEIVITQSMLIDRSRNLPSPHGLQLTEGIEALTRQTRELQEQVMSVRAQPVKTVFQRMPRTVRDLANTLGKEARLAMRGEDTEVDKTIIEELADPLTHMIRNALDHGVERPDERLAAGKPAEGLITLAAEQRGGRIVITVSDDGRGLNREKLFAKAVSRGVMAADAKPSPAEIDMLIFHAGLSTAEAVTDVSGRGVGMDVVKQNVEALGGRIAVESEPGRGCSFALSLPLTLAVADGMVVRIGEERMILPIGSIMETLQIGNCSPAILPGGGEIVRLRGEIAPLLRLRELLGLGAPRAGGGPESIVISAETDRGEVIGIAVDEILGQQQVVVKSLEASFGPVPGASAATILGDGMVALILDVDALPALAQARARARGSSPAASRAFTINRPIQSAA